MKYSFIEKEVFEKISEDWKKFMENTKSNKCVVGISGGIDSTCVAALACKIFGKENVYGVSMPCDIQQDIADVFLVYSNLGINRLSFNIGDIYHDILDGVENNALEVSENTKINLPPRLRMAILYAFSQSIPGSMVINTCNISESVLGYDTLWGDDCGSYAPIKNLTKTEVRKLAWWLGVDANLVTKTPIDGLQALSDEERFGFSYADLDKYIRTGEGDVRIIADITEKYNKNKFKLEIINIQGPDFNFPDYVQGRNI